MSNNIVSRLKRKKIEEVLEAGTRMDGRGLTDFREIQVKTSFLEKSEGSAEVRIGKTHVVVGVKAGLGTPFEDTPDEGVLMCNAEYTPVAHQTWEPGPPPEGAIELARVVDRGLRSAEILNMEDLGLVSGEKVYIVFVDLYVLNWDGNLIDACGLGALAALKEAKIPVFKVSKKNEVSETDKTKKLELRCEPIPITIYKIGKHFILDATADEEEVADGRLTVTLDENNNVTTLQKSGAVGFTVDELKKCINIAEEKAAEIRSQAVASE
ncbi:MAG: exosome complex protein Rrp42 [Candidatus Bathyarchaeota archaeon]|nr:exosome complex protein Rrp42 [Candidatus Bathyarchaeota archaeon]